MKTPKKTAALTALVVTTGLVAASCSGASKEPAEKKDDSASSSASTSAMADSTTTDTSAAKDIADTSQPVTIENCGKQVTFTKRDNLFVHDGNIISIVLAAGGADKIKAVSSMGLDKPTLVEAYGKKTIDGLKQVAEKYPTVEQIVAEQPGIYVAGWNYGLTEAKNLTPEVLKEHGIDTYILTESCRQEGTTARGVVDPWTSVNEDLENMGIILGDESKAQSVIDNIAARREALSKAPKPEKTPTVFVFDSGTDTIFTAGKFAAPTAIIEAADGKNATADLNDSWVKVGWEKLAAAQPDAFVMVDYPGQTFEEKVEQLKTNPVTKDMEAVKKDRFINLPYALWTASPLNIDAAEYVRKGLETFELVPASDITTELTLPADLAGQQYFLPKK